MVGCSIGTKPGNARSPTAEWHISGTMSVDVVTDLNRRRESTYTPLCRVHRKDMAEPSNGDNGT